VLDSAWVIPCLPAASFVLILFFGKRLPKGGSELGIAAVGLAFLLSCVAGVQWIQRVNDAGHHEAAMAFQEEHGGEEGGVPAEGEHAGAEPVTTEVTWLQSGGHEFTAGTLVDGLTVMMLFVVTTVSLLVHVYSTDYVHGDRRYTHFFAFLSLFTASMLALVMSRSTLQLLVCWELVGLCSFVLIGHWWEEKANSDAALKAFLTNRVGDVGLIVGVIVLFFAAGTFDIVEINTAANEGAISHLLLLVASCSLIAAVMSKSGQFFLHTWLPDAMAGPTPVSALIHAATMVVAGVFMVARMYGVFWNGLSIGDANLNLLAVIGGVTTLVGASLAFVQSDIKKVLAYSTISQLGYMVLALGVGAWTAAVFHLFTHAFFKACLFLGAGSVSHAVHSFDMKADMGGLRKWMPQTFRTFVIASIALAGIPPLAGFWSKDEILAGASQLGGGGDGYPVVLVMGSITALLTAAYMTRAVYLTFFGEFRGHGHPHESGPRIVVPLWILAGLAIVAGFANLPEALAPEGVALRFEHYVEPVAAYFPDIAHPEFSWALAAVSTLLALSGVAAGYAWYFRNLGPHGISERNRAAGFGHRLLVNRYYLDHLYTGVIAGGIKGPVARAAYWVNQKVIDGVVNGAGLGARRAGHYVYDVVDQKVVDGVVNGTGLTAEGSGQVLRGIQSGKVQQYAALLFAGAALLAGVFVIVI
jgi:NADH-quinone oxidoreductase subunit L